MRDIMAHLAPEHHRNALPEAFAGLLPPVRHHPLERCVLYEHEDYTDEDAGGEEEVQARVLLKNHAGELALKLALGRVLAATSVEIHVRQVLDKAALVVLQDALVKVFLRKREERSW